MKRSNTIRKQLTLAAMSTVLSLSVAECAFRVHLHLAGVNTRTDDAWRQRLRHMNAIIYRRSDDARLIYEPSPGQQVAMPYGTAGFNAAAMRDDHDHPEQPDQRLRVAVLGDSITWGEDVALADSLPRQLEVAMNPARTEVLNFGVTGYDTGQEAAWYERAVRRFHPAVLVLVYCLNDTMIMSGPYNRYATPDEAQRKIDQDALFDQIAPLRAETLDDYFHRREHDAVFALFARARSLYGAARYARSDDYTDEYLIAFAQPDRVARMRDSLRAVASAVIADGARPHLVISPILRDWRHYHWRGIHAEVTRAARGAGFAVHDPLDGWQRSESADSLRLPGDSLHYGAAGNRVLARYIAARLADPTRSSP